MPNNASRKIELFNAAMVLPAEQRRAYLAEKCAGNEAVLQAVLNQIATGEASEARSLFESADRAGDVTRKMAGVGAGDAGTDADGPTVSGPTLVRPLGRAGTGAGAVPDRIGRYTITKLLGKGGMGAVYLAQQDSPSRTVALKVIQSRQLSPELLRRFGRESQVLGRLQHPGIAQVFEAGTITDDHGDVLPFFAMEYIKGVPLTDYAAERKLGTRQRLELMARICDAVYHAHQKGVIHRDLKPDNIIVDDTGQPKILDFGIARATDGDTPQSTMATDIGQIIGTMPYMSPEQVSDDPGDLDTRSDVYALGVIAYELLAGRMPYDLPKKLNIEAVRIIREEDPTRLSNINRTLRGDVETIVAKALEKDKARRYQSAESLASDIRRYLSDEPISARPASTWYQVQKFSSRNKGLVAGVGATFVVLVAGVVATGVALRWALTAQADLATQLQETEKARAAEAAERSRADERADAATKAEREAKKQEAEAKQQTSIAEAVAKFQTDMLAAVHPTNAPTDPATGEPLKDRITVLQALQAAVKQLDSGSLKDQPLVEASVRDTIGSTLLFLARYDDAEPNLRKVVAIRRAALPAGHPDIATSLSILATVLRAQNKAAEAESLYRESLEIRRAALPAGHPDTASSLNGLAQLLRAQNKLAEAEPLFREALEIYRKVLPDGHPDIATCLNNLTILLRAQNKLAEAEPLVRESLAIWRNARPAGHPDIATGLSNLAGLLQAQNKLAEAEPLVRESLAIFRNALPAGHPDIALALNNLAGLLYAQNKLAEAEPLFRESLEVWRNALPAGHPHIAQGLNNLAFLLQAENKLVEAEPLFSESLEIYRKALPDGHPDIANSLSNLARTQHALGQTAEARARWDEAIAMLRKGSPEGSPLLARVLWRSGSARLENKDGPGDAAAAVPELEEAASMAEKVLPPEHPQLKEYRETLAKCKAAIAEQVQPDAKGGGG